MIPVFCLKPTKIEQLNPVILVWPTEWSGKHAQDDNTTVVIVRLNSFRSQSERLFNDRYELKQNWLYGTYKHLPPDTIVKYNP